MESYEERIVIEREDRNWRARYPNPVHLPDYNYPLPEPIVRSANQPDVPITAEILPLKLIDASTSDFPGRLQVVAGVLSSGRFEFQGLPDGMSEGDDPPFYLTVTTSGYVYLVVIVSLSGGSPVSIDSVTVEAAITVPSDTSTNGHFSLGTFAYDTSGDFAKTVPISAGGDVGYLYADGHYFW